jgi:hypothetical protein
VNRVTLLQQEQQPTLVKGGHRDRVIDLTMMDTVMKKALIAASLLTVFAAASTQACDKPQNRPAIPDPTTAVTAQMVKTNNEVKAYVRATESYLSCAKLSSNELRSAETELKDYAEEFNKTIRTFKQLNS